MWTSKFWWAASSALAVVFILLIVQTLKPATPTWAFSGENWAFKTGEKQLIVLDSTTAESELISSLWPFEFGPIPTTVLSDLISGETMSFADTKIHKLDDNIWKIQSQSTDWLVFGPNFETFPITSKISTQSDFWILPTSANLPDQMPAPRKAVIYQSTRTPKKELKTWLEQTNTRLIELKNYEAVKFRWSGGNWQIQTTSKVSENN